MKRSAIILEIDIKAVLGETERAYMRDAFSLEAWETLVKWLLANGYSVIEAAAELNSKSVRWATDCNADGKISYGNYPAAWVIDYYETGNNFVIPKGSSDEVTWKEF